MAFERKRPVPEEAQVVHARIASNLRTLMQLGPGRKNGVLATAKAAGISHGSLQAILDSNEHSPSIRLLVRLAAHFGLPSVGTLTDSVIPVPDQASACE